VIPASATPQPGASVAVMGNRTSNHPKIRRALSGLDRLIADTGTISRLAERQVGLLANHASTTANGIPASLALNRCLSGAGSGDLRLYSPEHGITLDAHAGESVNHGTDPLTGLAVSSLYGAGEDESDAFDGIDTLVIDLRDVGVRCYTYAATAARAARTALERHIEVILCDRANPLGRGTEGPRPDPALHSFLAYFDVPFVHGHTMAELLSRHIAPAIGEAPYLIYPADIVMGIELGWTPPSPALPHPDAVAAYAGLVLLEATNISEGRGSSLSFRGVSAPGLDAATLAVAINGWNTGFAAHPATLTGMRPPQDGSPLPAVVVWPRGRQRRYPLALGVQLLEWLHSHYPDFAWLPGADGRPGGAIETLFGRTDLREKIDTGTPAITILNAWL